MKKYLAQFLFWMSLIILLGSEASALPAFARRENRTCITCHANGSAPHLKEFGYRYRRMAFHWPGKLGDEKADDAAMNVTNHSAVGVNVAYQYSDTSVNRVKSIKTDGISVPAIEIWPLEGGFFGNWGIWSVVDTAPTTNGGGGFEITAADVRYAYGTTESFMNFRGGFIAPEGYGASDQWFDDGNLPLLEKMSANKNQDTLVTPWGALMSPEMGFEVGFNYDQSFLTLGIYNGYSAVSLNTNGTFSAATSLQAAKAKPYGIGMSDYRFQYDQFLGTLGEITLGYYKGSVPLAGPTSTFGWLNHFDQARFYLTAYVVPSVLDFLGGAGWAKNEYVTTTTNPVGTFENVGEFLGFNYYANPHLTVSGRWDQYFFNSNDKATGYSLQISFPNDNRIFIFHYNNTDSDIASGGFPVGINNDIGLTLRFLL